ncbi:MAG: hypothetical protein ACYTFG_20680, partial [Planctomycetota bacterium]
MSEGHSRFRVFATLAVFSILMGGAAPVLACGFHSTFLAKKITPKKWWEYHKHEYVEEKKPSQIISGGGDLEPSFFKKKASKKPTAEGRGKRKALIAMVVKHLMYMNKTNIIPSEFPDFNESVVPEFMKSFKAILVELGPDAVPFILDAYLVTLFGSAPHGQDLSRNRKFQDDMIEVLMRIGRSSIAAIASYAAKARGGKSRNAVLTLVGKVTAREPTLKPIPGLIQAALRDWAVGGANLLEVARRGDMGVPEKALVFQVWLGLAWERRAEADILALFRDKEFPTHLRADVVDFLAGKEHLPAVESFLKVILDGQEELFVRRCGIMGIWELHLLRPEASMSQVKGELGLKNLLTSPAERPAIRIACIFLLANLDDDTLLDSLVVLLNREKENEGVCVAALDGLERLKLKAEAAARIDRQILARRDHIADVRFRLLDLFKSRSDKDVAPAIVKIVIHPTEYVPMRLKGLIALKTLGFTG